MFSQKLGTPETVLVNKNNTDGYEVLSYSPKIRNTFHSAWGYIA